MKRFALAIVGLLVLALTPAFAQDAAPAQKPADKPAAEKTAEEKLKEGFREEVVVVSATRTESTLINAPATMSVISADTIATSPAQNYGDLLRSTPGLNVIQTSARDINLTSRQATSTLANSQLVMIDGRSIYLDFFDLVLWDFVPQNTAEIKQIEVVRGPASAVWGANALTGVVNIITKTPRDAQGFNLNLQGGLFKRSKGALAAGDSGDGFLYGANFSFAQAPSEKFAWRLSAGYFNSDPFARPEGQIPLACNPLGADPCRVRPDDANSPATPNGFPVGGAFYPTNQPGLGSYVNEGTSQPKVDLRLDQELGDGGSSGRITYQGGYAGTTGIVHTGIGPFQLQSGSNLTYGKVQWTRNAMKIGAFGNFTDAEAPALLAVAPSGQPVQLNFTTQTYDIEFGNSNVLGGKNILSYGANYRRNNFTISLAPDSKDRNEFGAYFQEEFFTDRFRVSLGLRADKFGNLPDWVFSPRITLMYKPGALHSIRASFNRAFRSPSVINNFLQQEILSPNTIDLRPLGVAVPPLKPLIPQEPFFLVVNNVGSELVKPPYPLIQESLNAYELAYTGNVAPHTTLGIALYVNRSNNNINFTQLTPTSENPEGLPGLTYYDALNPAQGVGAVSGQPITLSPALMAFINTRLPVSQHLPDTVATYLNLGPLQNKGIELSLDHSFSNELTAFANYSYQDTPEIQDADSGQIRYPITEASVSPKNRFNVGLNWGAKRYLGSVSANYSDSGFWSDVLSGPYQGFTDSFTLVNASFGMKWNDGKIITTLKGTNLLNQTVQQHIYGDIMQIGVAFQVSIYTK